MGHHISAIVCRPSRDVGRLADFDLPVLRAGDFVIIPMDAGYCDDWTERLDLAYGPNGSEVIFDCPFAHHVAGIGAAGEYALIETDYFGGHGDQVAAVYRKGVEEPLFASQRVRRGAINDALRKIGVRACKGMDEFDTLGLGRHRDFDHYFERYE